jgi:hypothetical protein
MLALHSFYDKNLRGIEIVFSSEFFIPFDGMPAATFYHSGI